MQNNQVLQSPFNEIFNNYQIEIRIPVMKKLKCKTGELPLFPQALFSQISLKRSSAKWYTFTANESKNN
jgi:hypothetical protein